MAMTSETMHNSSRSQRRSLIPVRNGTHHDYTTKSPLDPKPNGSTEPEPLKPFYTDSDIQECPPDGDSAPLFPFPGDDAKNTVVREYLFDILTKTGWGIAIDFRKEIRATINAFIGTGWALRRRYAEDKLKELCPIFVTTNEDGILNKHKVSASTRSNIGKCIMREMERYFEEEKRAHNGSQHGSNGDKTLVSGPPKYDTRISYLRDIPEEEEDEEIAPEFRRRPRNRTPLPDEWMSESLRARTNSRLCERSDNEPAAKAVRARGFPVYINKEAAWPMPTNILSRPQTQRQPGRSNKLAMGQPGNLTAPGEETSKHIRRPTTSPYQTIPGSLLPRPKSCFEYRSLPRATEGSERNTLRSISSCESVGFLPSNTTLTEETPAEGAAPAESEVAEQEICANGDGGATSYEMSPITEDNEQPGDVTEAKPHLIPTITEADDQSRDVTEPEPRPISTITNEKKAASESHKKPCQEDIEEAPKRLGMIEELELWQKTHRLSTTTTIMNTPQPSNAAVESEDPDVITPAPPRFPYGYSVEVNKVPAGRQQMPVVQDVKKIPVVQEAEVPSKKEANVRATVTPAKKKGILKRLWRKVRGGKK